METLVARMILKEAEPVVVCRQQLARTWAGAPIIVVNGRSYGLA